MKAIKFLINYLLKKGAIIFIFLVKRRSSRWLTWYGARPQSKKKSDYINKPGLFHI